jgi:predicted dehydrogenase
MHERVRIGVIGCGMVAQAEHLQNLLQLSDRFEIAALADPSPTVRDAIGARYAVARAYEDHRGLLDAGGIDAVVISSPAATHAEIVIDALAAGLHVFVEKPLCITLADADRIVAARDRASKVVQVGYMKRFDPAVEALLAELPDAWSPLHITTATFDPGMREAFGLGPAPPMGVEEAFLGALVHDVNLVRAVLERTGGAVDRVVDAFGGRQGPRIGATVALADGARWTAVWLALPEAGTFRQQLAFYGQDGVRELEFPAPYVLHQPTVCRHVRAGGGGSVTTSRESWREAYERQLVHFHACITERAACRTPAEQGAEDVRLLAEMVAGVAA